MIHRFVDLLEEVLEPNVVFLTNELSPDFRNVLWKAGNLATPVRMSVTQIASNTANADDLADPERSPDGNDVVYCRVGYNTVSPANKTGILVVDWDNTATTEIYSETGGLKNSLQPTWKPDGSKILFRAKGAGTTQNLVKHMDPDGTNVATLYTGASLLLTPYYSPDGTKIAFGENGAIKVMNADGTGLATVVAANAGAPTWFRTANVIAFISVTGSMGWRKINADGTGLTTLSTTFNFTDPDSIKWSVMEDDSAIVTWDALSLVYIDTGGAGVTAVSPAQTIGASTPDSRPVCLEGRVWFPQESATGFTEVWSILPDGSDARKEFDGIATSQGPSGGDVLFHGFKGDTLNV